LATISTAVSTSSTTTRGCPVGAEDPEGLIAIARAGIQVHHLACAEMPQPLGGNMAQPGDRLI
jgi:hypothetical protein